MPPSHLIAREEVGAWLADSGVRVVTTHRTDRASARDIIQRGVDIARTSLDAGWGQGFYSATIPDPRYGEAEVRVAVRLTRPLVIRDSARDVEALEVLTERAGTDDFREAIMAAGYDGVVIHYGPGDMSVVAYRNDQVKVIAEGDEDA